MTRSNKGRLCLLTGTILSFGLGTQAHAQQFPAVSGEVVIELQNQYNVDSDDADVDGNNNLFLRTEVAPTVQFTDNFYLDGVVVLEPLLDFDANDNTFFEDEGIFVEEIKLNYDHGNWSLFAGKFNPGFGIAWDFGRGIFGEDFAEDYEITERIGGGVSYTFEGENTGSHTLTGNSFFADTTFLSESLGTQRGNTSEDDGGISNTESFESFVVSLDGEDVAGIEGLYYKLGYRDQSAGDADVGGEDEDGYVVTLGHAFPVTERVGADVLLEYADINNFDGGADDNTYFTASLITTLDDNWNVTVGYTERDIDVDGGADVDDHLLQVSAGYDFGQGTTAELGWRNSEEGGTDTDIIGGLVRHVFEF